MVGISTVSVRNALVCPYHFLHPWFHIDKYIQSRSTPLYNHNTTITTKGQVAYMSLIYCHLEYKRYPEWFPLDVYFDKLTVILFDCFRQEANYQPKQVEVISPNGDKMTCRVYEIVQRLALKPLPSPQYLDVIVSGACQSGLPDYYIHQLKALPHNDNSKTVDIYEGMKNQGISLGKLWE